MTRATDSSKAAPRTFFITATDTGAGKTCIACGMLEAARLAGLSTAAAKPLAAGAMDTPEGPRNEDAVQLARQCTVPLRYHEINPCLYREAIAPHIAAQRRGESLSAARLADYCRAVMEKGAALTVLEGAGGWQVPLNDRETVGDVARILQVPVILVVAMRLGCINHALLSAQAIRAEGVRLAGWVANSAAPAMAAYKENLDALKRLLPAPLLAEIPYLGSSSGAASCADHIALENFWCIVSNT